MTAPRRVELEDERDFLLSSLADLEAERAAGDVDELDFEQLKDSYVRRTAEVLRALENLDAPKPVGRRRAPWRAVAWGAAVTLVAVVTGVLVARGSGERLPGQTMTGAVGDGSVSSMLVEARAVGMGDIPRALDLYSRVLAVEPDNVEALTYFGWLTLLSTVRDDSLDDATFSERMQSGLVLLRQATIADDTYPDAHCFLGIAFFRFFEDAEAAQPEVRACLDSNPPAEVSGLVAGLEADVEAALAATAPGTTDPGTTDPGTTAP